MGFNSGFKGLNSGNASYQSFVLPLLCKHVKIRVHKYNIVCFSYGWATWSLNLRKDHRLRAFENKMPSKVLWPKVEGIKRRMEKLHKAS